MSKDFRLKYFDFLKKYNLYDWVVFQYFIEQSVEFDYQENLFIGCSRVFDRNERICTIVPCIPTLTSDKAVAINIYVYVNWLIINQKRGKIFEEDFYSQVLPLFYQKLYMLENNNAVLLNFDKQIEEFFLKDGSYNNKILLQSRDILIKDYYDGKDDIQKVARQAKRLTKKYIYYEKNYSKI